MATIQDVLNVARGEIGYSRWNDPEQGTKYGRWYAEMTGDPYYGYNGVPYCAMFVSWVFDQAGASAAGIPGAYCPWIVNAAYEEGRAVYNEDSQPGDIVLFDWDHDGVSDHVGIVESNEGDWVQTIEGNTDGGQVLRRARSWDTVICVYRPYWDQETVENPNARDVSYDLSKGIDIYNGEGDAGFMGWETEASFVICKASEGIGFVDRYAAQFAENVLNAGKLLGFYHFARQNDPIAEADFFVGCVKDTGYLGEATLWLDYEADALANGPGWCEQFIDRVNQLTGKRCGIYTSQSVTNEQDFSNIAYYVPLWIAQYASMNPVHGWQEAPWSSWNFGAWGSDCAIHQYTGNGYVEGWPRALDLNRGYFTLDQWNYWVHGDGGYVPPEPAPSPSLEVDGWIGPDTVSEWQRQLGTYVDGVVSGQYRGNQGYLYRLVSATWEATGSPMVKAVQRTVGVDADGILGPDTIAAIQRMLGVDDDGYLGPQTAVAIQNSLNDGIWG